MENNLKERITEAIISFKAYETNKKDMKLKNISNNPFSNLFNFSKNSTNFKAKKEIEDSYDILAQTLDWNVGLFSEKIDLKFMPYILNDVFYDALEKSEFTLLEIGEITDYVLGENYQITLGKRFLLSNIKLEQEYNKKMKEIHKNPSRLFKMLVYKSLRHSYKNILRPNKKEAIIFEEYLSKMTTSNELHKRVYKTILYLKEHNKKLSQAKENEIKELLSSINVDERFINAYLNYLRTIYKEEKIETIKVEEKVTLSRNEIRRRLSKYYDMSREEVNGDFNYENFREVLVLLKELNMVEERNDIVFHDLSKHPIINEAYLNYLYEKFKFQLPKDTDLHLLEDYMEECKKSNPEDALFWKNQIRKILLNSKEKLQASFSYENEELKRVKNSINN